MNKNSIKSSIILSLGLIVSSIILGLTFCYVRSRTQAYISVKGLSEREVDANVGIWTINFKAAGNYLDQVYTQIEQQTEILVGFLKQQGFVDKEIICTVPELRDSREYNNARLAYSISMEVVVHTSKVSLLCETVQKSKKLLEMGVRLADRWRSLQFIFTNLNAIKPSMIQEATINAKKAADQFTIDASVQLGMLRKASQGSFSIEDTHVPTKKKVRVVTQMEYAIQ